MKSLVTSFLFTLLVLAAPFAASEPTRHSVNVNGHDLTLWEKSHPKPSKEPSLEPSKVILLLHGRTYSSLPDFDLKTRDENLSFMDGLVDRGFKVFALDARGYGGTERDASGWLTPNTMVVDVIHVLEWISSETGQVPHLFGWSYGSMVAQMVAQRQPELIQTMTLFGYPFDPERHVVAKSFEYPAIPPMKPNTPTHAASDFIVPGSISNAAIAAYVEAALKADPIRVDVKDLHEWAELDARQVTTPTLLLQGEFDPIAPTKIQQDLFTNLNTAKKWWAVLEGGDHAALLETPRVEMLDLIALFADHAD